ncbi:nucleoside 3'/5'-monophosphate phosphatase and short-chain exopolyphosphatase SurE [Syntrophotalea carbinolica DSM 2380]|uniref:5'-nucleotidase SurE n=1 Tax=Syntrophotalea carbinolica (strain DSM 2380 / NBRC 103641 / GraBd1) TaxID=338963 RepID=SURE_SYNC1|nr:5'/3'-nucleotidase SurE [Syntrophotalea carbinolica]Q3A4N5.1 RecName: Full=5'-nucleotidase SurE; AltName: Full=Nucleoside 5'-monophosphate phosphohydrolase [Syntrophotalea carbinolica DSM 2380]ABA88672.1 nucleoside 3'/5'-monophosphate phosphatase and short-chain exopolyphosphatase SurE [Syntrophotalea carbinolica DSM 2380]
MLILVTNDDGVHAPGIAALADSLHGLGQVVVVAPDRDRSAIGHALTLHAPLRADELRPGVFAVDGTPTDCVNLGIHGLLSSVPDLVVAGINRGANLGDDITYSGTVCAAMEATLMGVPALAVSLEGDTFASSEYRQAADAALFLAQKVSEEGLPSDTFLNVNVPAGRIRGIRLTRQGRRRYGDMVVEKMDPRGRKYYWLGAGECDFDYVDGTDCHAMHEGFISVTPLHLDLTNFRSFECLSRWSMTYSMD